MAISQFVVPTSALIEQDLTVSGNFIANGDFTVNGTTTTINTSNTTTTDTLFELNSGIGATENINDIGVIFARGSAGDNALIIWDESADRFALGTTLATGASSGDIVFTKGTLEADLAGNASSATQLQTSRTIELTGEVTGSTTFNGTATASIAATIAADVVSANELNVVGNGLVTEYLRSNADGSFSWDTPVDTNNYVTGVSFATGTGVLTATRQGLGDLTVSLDGRYLTAVTSTDVSYDNVASGLTATNVKDAIDEVSAAVGAAGTVQVFSQSTEPTVWNQGDFWIQTA